MRNESISELLDLQAQSKPLECPIKAVHCTLQDFNF